MNDRNTCFFISEIVSGDLIKNIDSEISIELDYIIHQSNKMELETACDEMRRLRSNLLKEVNKFYTIDAISHYKRLSLEAYIKEKIGKSIFYIKTIVYESEVNDN